MPQKTPLRKFLQKAVRQKAYDQLRQEADTLFRERANGYQRPDPKIKKTTTGLLAKRLPMAR